PPTPAESRKRLMHIPLAFGLVGRDGEDVAYGEIEGAAAEDGVIHIRKRRHVIRFSGISERPALSLNRGFSAPVTLSVEQDPGDRFFLARHDSDLVARWQVWHGLLSEAVIAAVRGEPGSKPAGFSGELTEVAGA